MKFKNTLQICLLLIASNISAQSNEVLAKSYFLQAEEAFGNEATESAINHLDNCVQALGETNAKIEALYIKIKMDNLVDDYYNLEVKRHLDNYLKIASSNRPEYEEIVKLATNIKRRAEKYSETLRNALKENTNRNWDDSGPIYIEYMGYFNSNGELAIESNFGRGAEPFRDGFALIKKYSNRSQYKMYIINKNGESFSKTLYDEIYRVDDGVYITVLKINNEDSYEGLINTKINVELKSPYFIAYSINQFQENGLAVYSVENKNSEYLEGLINKKGEIILKASYGEIGLFKNGLANASGNINDGYTKHRFLKPDGSVFYSGTRGIYLGDFTEDEIFTFRYGNKYGYKKLDSYVAPIQSNYYNASDFSEGLAIVKNNDRYIIINSKNEKVGAIEKEFRQQYRDYELFKYGKAILQNTNLDSYFVINRNGQVILDNIKSESLSIIGENLLLSKKGNYSNYDLINLDSKKTTNLNEINGLNISKIYSFNEGLALFTVIKSGTLREVLYGYINTNGKVVIPPTYSEAETYQNGKAIVYDKYFNKTVISPLKK
jgi:hypothetical protein